MLKITLFKKQELMSSFNVESRDPESNIDGTLEGKVGTGNEKGLTMSE